MKTARAASMLALELGATDYEYSEEDDGSDFNFEASARTATLRNRGRETFKNVRFFFPPSEGRVTSWVCERGDFTHRVEQNEWGEDVDVYGFSRRESHSLATGNEAVGWYTLGDLRPGEQLLATWRLNGFSSYTIWQDSFPDPRGDGRGSGAHVLYQDDQGRTWRRFRSRPAERVHASELRH